MKIITLNIPDVILLIPDVYKDSRGFFMETWNYETYAKLGIKQFFVQDNHSLSVKNTLRGLHYQLVNPQAKLVRVAKGIIFDVAVDLRENSQFFGMHAKIQLSAEDNRLLYIPAGFAHGFLVLSDEAEIQYKCSDYYNPSAERCIAWNDQELAIEWPLSGAPVLSEKDKNGVPFKNAEKFQF